MCLWLASFTVALGLQAGAADAPPTRDYIIKGQWQTFHPLSLEEVSQLRDGLVRLTDDSFGEGPRTDGRRPFLQAVRALIPDSATEVNSATFRTTARGEELDYEIVEPRQVLTGFLSGHVRYDLSRSLLRDLDDNPSLTTTIEVRRPRQGTGRSDTPAVTPESLLIGDFSPRMVAAMQSLPPDAQFPVTVPSPDNWPPDTLLTFDRIGDEAVLLRNVSRVGLAGRNNVSEFYFGDFVRHEGRVTPGTTVRLTMIVGVADSPGMNLLEVYTPDTTTLPEGIRPAIPVVDPQHGWGLWVSTRDHRGDEPQYANVILPAAMPADEAVEFTLRVAREQQERPDVPVSYTPLPAAAVNGVSRPVVTFGLAAATAVVVALLVLVHRIRRAA